MAPQALTFIDQEVDVRGDTSSTSDEFASLDCESRGAASPLNGPQPYYSVSTRGGATYSFDLVAAFHSILYGFDERTSCSHEELQSACRSEGVTGFASGLINPGTGGPIFELPPDFTPEEDMELILVVDSDGGSGSYQLTVRETLP